MDTVQQLVAEAEPLFMATIFLHFVCGEVVNTVILGTLDLEPIQTP